MAILDRFRLDGRRACVTGGSRGLGLEIARGLAEAGADLVLIGRDPQALSTARDELSGTGRRVDVLPADVGDPGASEAAARRVLEEHGPVDILVNNVGGRRIDTPTEDLPLEDWRRILDLNLTSCFLWSKLLGGAMLSRGRGRVINVASLSGKRVKNDNVAYAMTKHALMAMTHSTRRVGWDDGVRATAVCPSFVDTDLTAGVTKVAREEMIDAADLAELIATAIALPNNAVVAEMLVNCRLEDLF